MTVIGGAPQPPNPEPHFIMEVRKAVSPPTEGRKQTATAAAPPLPASVGGGGAASASASLSSAQSSLVNQNLISATMETKGDVVEVKQQIPSKLAKLSLAGGSKAKDKKSSSNLRHNLGGSTTALGQPSAATAGSGPPQMLPYKLSESEKKSSISPKGGGGGGYQKLSSSSFAEERMGRAAARGGGGGGDESTHTRTGSSPAAMTGRPMSNTLPKSVSRSESPEQRPGGGGGQQPLVQRVNYADSGEEVFFF